MANSLLVLELLFYQAVNLLRLSTSLVVSSKRYVGCRTLQDDIAHYPFTGVKESRKGREKSTKYNPVVLGHPVIRLPMYCRLFRCPRLCGPELIEAPCRNSEQRPLRVGKSLDTPVVAIEILDINLLRISKLTAFYSSSFAPPLADSPVLACSIKPFLTMLVRTS